MRIVRPKMKKTKVTIAAAGIVSGVVLIVGVFLMNPFCIGAGIAGLFLTCGVAVSFKKPRTSHPYV